MDRTTATENFVKFQRVVIEICERIGRETDTKQLAIFRTPTRNEVEKNNKELKKKNKID